MNKHIRSFVLKHAGIVNYLPFVNSFSLHGTKADLNHKLFIKTKFNCQGIGNKIVCGNGGSVRYSNIYIRGNDNTVIIKDNSIVIRAEFWLEGDGNIIEIGTNTSICGKTHLACIEGTRISIGNNCLLSSNIVLRTGDSHNIYNIDGLRINPSSDIVIGDHVWIGYGAMINKGVHISDNTVIGNGSIVTRSFEEAGIIIAGVPAKQIKDSITWD